MRTPAVALLLLLTACGAAPADAPEGGDGALHLRVLATHDFHGALRPTIYSWSEGRPVGGASALSATLTDLEMACACPTIRVDGGDQLQGTLDSNLTSGVPVVAMFNAIGLDAAAVGNHELDWGVDTLLSRQAEARYGWLAANVFLRDTGERPAWAEPFAIVERDGVRVGVIGYATTSTARIVRPDVVRPYEFRAGYAGIRQALDDVRAEDPDFVVVVAHAGGQCGDSDCGGEMADLAAELPPGAVHLIAGGHTHSAGEGVVNAIPILRAGSSGRAVGVIDLFRRADGTHDFQTSIRTVYADELPEDEALTTLLEPYLREADRLGRERVTTLGEPLSASRTGDGRLGHFIAEAARLRAGADVGLHNPGGVRADLPAGAVSYAQLHRVLPFDNALVRLDLSGRQLRALVAQAGPAYYYSNLQVEFDPSAGATRRVAALRLGDGTEIGDETIYTLATPDYLAEGGDGLTVLERQPRELLGVLLLDAVADRLRSLPAPVTLPPAASPRGR